MSKRYSGKSFKDSSVSKKPKLNLKEKRKLKREKSKKKIKLSLLFIKSFKGKSFRSIFSIFKFLFTLKTELFYFFIR